MAAASFRPESTHASAVFAYGLLLVFYGNAVSAAPRGFEERFGWLFILIEYLFVAASVVWAVRARGLSLEALGLTASRARKHAVLGAGAGILLILPVAVYLAFPFASPGGSIGYGDAPELGSSSFLAWALLLQPLGTSVPEEILFRGVLQGLGQRAFSAARAIALSAAVFALWHIVVNYRAVQDTTASESVAATLAAQSASMAVLLIGGVAFGVLRYRTGSLAAPIAFHWATVVAMNVALGAGG